MENANPARAILGGLVATLVMTLMMYAAPMIGMPMMDIAGMLASMFNGWETPAALSGVWWIGMAIHFINGTIIFPLIYAYLIYAYLPGSPAVRGLQWGLVLWFLAEAMVMPMLGARFLYTHTPQPMMPIMVSLIGHLSYGLILSAIAGVQARPGLQALGPQARTV